MKLLVASVALLSVATALAQYTCEVLPMAPGFDSARPTAIGHGKVVGTASGPSGGGACVWEGANHTFRLLSLSLSSAETLAPGIQGGRVHSHATIWIDGLRLGVDIHPTGYSESRVMGMDANSYVGDAIGYVTGNQLHAVLWEDRGSEVVKLDPSGFNRSSARGVSGQFQVGFAQKTYYSPETAAIWQGSAASMRYLSLPKIATTSIATTIRGNVIGGYFYGSNGRLPILWKVDNMTFSLLPMPTTLYGGEVGNGFVSGTNGTVHVGGFRAFSYPWLDRDVGAAWVGNPPEFVNLNDFLPPHLANTDCHVTGIDDEGNITGWVYSIYVGNQPVIWKPIK